MMKSNKVTIKSPLSTESSFFSTSLCGEQGWPGLDFDPFSYVVDFGVGSRLSPKAFLF